MGTTQDDGAQALMNPIIDISTATELIRTQPNDVVIADVRWYLDGRSGRAAFESGHVPGAIWIDLDADLSDHSQPATEGRHPFPTAAHFAEAMSGHGIGDDSMVIAYDDAGGSTAGRLVWMLRVIGHRAALLDGGLNAWPPPLEHGPSAPRSPAPFTMVDWPQERFATADDLGRPAITDIVLDARANDRYRGLNEVVDQRAGHIPYALNAPWAANIDPSTNTFKSVEQLRDQYHAAGVDNDSSVICYCGSGVSACNDLLVLEHIGVINTRLFVPSWSGWSAEPTRAIATGTE